MRDGDGGEQEPHADFPQRQAFLPDGREPELDFRGAEGNDVAVAEPRGSLRRIVDGGKSPSHRLQAEAGVFLEFKNQVPLPFSFVFPTIAIVIAPVWVPAFIASKALFTVGYDPAPGLTFTFWA